MLFAMDTTTLTLRMLQNMEERTQQVEGRNDTLKEQRTTAEERSRRDMHRMFQKLHTGLMPPVMTIYVDLFRPMLL